MDRTPACAHCGSPIVDAATLTRNGDELYCCLNCAAAARGAACGTLVCMHCGTPILERGAEWEQDNRIFCCPNCAAVDAGIAQPTPGATEPS